MLLKLFLLCVILQGVFLILFMLFYTKKKKVALFFQNLTFLFGISALVLVLIRLGQLVVK